MLTSELAKYYQQTEIMTAEELAQLLNISKRGLQKRIGGDYDLLAKMQSIGGRPKHYYFANKVMAKFGRQIINGEVVSLKQTQNDDDSIEIKKERKSRNDRGELRKPPCELTEKTIIRIVDRALEIYLQDSNEKNIRASVYRATRETTGLSDRDDDFEKIARYIYKKQVMRHDGGFIGYAFRGVPWLQRHRNQHKVDLTNKSMVNLSWDFYELFENAGIAKKNYGAGAFWAMDATQFDSWVIVDGEKKPRLVYYFLIIDVLTGFPLWFRPLENGESIREAIECIKDCVEIYGAPKYGFVLDNSTTFRSPRLKGYLKTLGVEEPEPSAMRMIKGIFHDVDFPVYYPLRRMPKYPMKSRIERTFGELTKVISELAPFSYKGGTEQRRTSYELGTTPTTALKLAPEFRETWLKFVMKIWNDEILSANMSIRSRFKAKGNKEIYSIADAFEYYGGDSLAALKKLGLPINNECRWLNEDKNEYIMLPAHDDNTEALQLYYEADDNEIGRHKLVTRGGMLVQKDNQTLNFICPELDARFDQEHIKIAYVLKNESGNIYAYFFLEHNPKKYNSLTPNKGDVYFIGKGIEATVKTVDSIWKLKQARRASQAVQEQVLNDAMPENIIKPQELARSKEYNEIKEVEIPKINSNNSIDDIFDF